MGDNNVIPLETGWNQGIKKMALDPLEGMLEEGFKKSKLFSNQDYVAVYSTCYNMCTQKAPHNWTDQIYQRHGESISNYLTNSVLPSLKDNEKSGENLLIEFVRRGENHKVMNKWYQRFFAYLDRYHVKYHQLPSLEDSGLRYYKLIVFNAIKSDVTTALISLINAERDGTIVNKQLIRSCIEVYETMGMGTLDSYISDFETQLLESTKVYYASKGSSWISEDSTPVYMVRVEKALEDERIRVQSYLNSESELKLLQVLDQVIILYIIYYK